MKASGLNYISKVVRIEGKLFYTSFKMAFLLKFIFSKYLKIVNVKLVLVHDYKSHVRNVMLFLCCFLGNFGERLSPISFRFAYLIK